MLTAKETEKRPQGIRPNTNKIKDELSLTSLSRELAKINIPRKIHKSTLTKLQDELVIDLCRPKHEKNLTEK